MFAWKKSFSNIFEKMEKNESKIFFKRGKKSKKNLTSFLQMGGKRICQIDDWSFFAKWMRRKRERERESVWQRDGERQTERGSDEKGTSEIEKLKKLNGWKVVNTER